MFLKNNKREIVFIALSIIILIAAGFLFKANFMKLTEAQKSHEKAALNAERASQKAGQIKTKKTQLATLKNKWDEEKKEYSVFVEGGLFFEILDNLAKVNNIENIEIKPIGHVDNFYQNHLHATAYNLIIEGPFLGVCRVLSGLETCSLPVELKPIIFITEEQATKVDTTAILYSTNPPSEYISVLGKSGKYDPFCNTMFQELEEYLNAQTSKSTEKDTEDTEDTEDIEDIENTKDTRDTEDNKKKSTDTENTEEVEKKKKQNSSPRES